MGLGGSVLRLGQHDGQPVEIGAERDLAAESAGRQALLIARVVLLLMIWMVQ